MEADFSVLGIVDGWLGDDVAPGQGKATERGRTAGRQRQQGVADREAGAFGAGK